MNHHAILRDPHVALGVECALPHDFQFAGADAARCAPRIADGADRLWRKFPREAPARRFRWRAPRLSTVLVFVLFALGAWQFGQGLYIHAKARLAQVLIRGAWAATLAGRRAVKPWPWADTWPVARITVPAADVELFVLAGANGRSIAFGPGHMYGTPLPGEEGNSVIGGHRDTHFAFLRNVRRGAEIAVERADGGARRYRVSEIEVLDKKETWVAKNEGPTRLTLVTCWPFDALRAGGPGRYVVTALATE